MKSKYRLLLKRIAKRYTRCLIQQSKFHQYLSLSWHLPLSSINHNHIFTVYFRYKRFFVEFIVFAYPFSCHCSNLNSRQKQTYKQRKSFCLSIFFSFHYRQTVEKKNCTDLNKRTIKSTFIRFSNFSFLFFLAFYSLRFIFFFFPFSLQSQNKTFFC